MKYVTLVLSEDELDILHDALVASVQESAANALMWSGRSRAHRYRAEAARVQVVLDIVADKCAEVEAQS